MNSTLRFGAVAAAATLAMLSLLDGFGDPDTPVASGPPSQVEHPPLRGAGLQGTDRSQSTPMAARDGSLERCEDGSLVMVPQALPSHIPMESLDGSQVYLSVEEAQREVDRRVETGEIEVRVEYDEFGRPYEVTEITEADAVRPIPSALCALTRGELEEFVDSLRQSHKRHSN